MKRVPLTIKKIDEKTTKFWSNRVKKVVFEYIVGDFKGEAEFIREMNEVKYSNKYLATEMMLAILDGYSYYLEYEGFKKAEDCAYFFKAFGYCSDVDACKNGFKVIQSLQEQGDELEKYWGKEVTFDELDKYREIYSDGEPELVLGVYDELVEKYFDFNFEKDFK